ASSVSSSSTLLAPTSFKAPAPVPPSDLKVEDQMHYQHHGWSDWHRDRENWKGHPRESEQRSSQGGRTDADPPERGSQGVWADGEE
ncbi:unnamed protein product, partial [Polarella glacialis]